MLEFYYSCKVTADIEKVVDFFSRSENLLKITPLSFLFSLEGKSKLENGDIIKVKLFGHDIMESLITNVSKEGFIDNGVKRPLGIKYWEHRHSFKPSGNKTLIEDRLKIDSAIPYAFIKPLLDYLFSYRCKKVKLLLE